MIENKEFVAVYASDTLAENYARILKDTTTDTQISYHKRYCGWKIRTPNELEVFIESLQQKWLDGQYRYATIRQYKAAISYALSNAWQFKIDQSKLNFKFKEYYDLSQLASADRLEDLYEQCHQLNNDSDIPALDKQALENEKTSTTKDKRFPQNLLNRILERDPVRYGFLQNFLVLNIKLGLRPMEYQNATLLRHDIAQNPALLKLLGFSNLSDDNALNLTQTAIDDTKPLLLIKNAKNSHSRACGDYRLLYLDVLSPTEIEKLTNMLEMMRDISQKSKKPFNQSVIKPISTQLYSLITHDSICQGVIKSLHNEKMRSYRKQSKKGFRNKPVFKRPTLYSTRHQAVANAKAAELHPVLIAACFGHSSVFTAENHYGKLVFGNKGLSVTPAQVSINEVIVRLTEAAIKPRIELDYNREPTADIASKPSAPTPKF